MAYFVLNGLDSYVKKKVSKQVGKLPLAVKENLFTLLLDIKRNGPIRGNWPIYGKLRKIAIIAT